MNARLIPEACVRIPVMGCDLSAEDLAVGDEIAERVQCVLSAIRVVGADIRLSKSTHAVRRSAGERPKRPSGPIGDRSPQ